MRVLVTGATGYIGGRLVPRLLRRGHQVRVLVRDPSRLDGRAWADQVEVVKGDLLDPDTLDLGFDSINAAYYLVHSMYAGGDYAERERRGVKNFCHAAGKAGTGHTIYLGGLLPQVGRVSKHLRSRAEVGRMLAEHVPTTEFRAGPIIGSGSASFEMLRYLTERLPLMLTPSWVDNQIQPIAVRDVLSYLIVALEQGPSGTVAIGSDRLTYRQMMLTYARIRKLRRLIISVPPILPAFIGARFIGWLTPIPSTLAIPLVEGMVQPLVTDESSRARELFPQVKPISYEKAVKLALCRIQQQAVETRWSSPPSEAPTYEYQDTRGLVREVRSLHVDAPPDTVYRIFSGLGGERGWLTWNWAWCARGFIDSLFGGPGLRRGRRHPEDLLVGEVVDFWRAEVTRRPNLLRLRAEAKLPGSGWLQWEAISEGGGTRLTQTAAFAPRGLPGALYWYALYPFHRLIFTDMIKAIGRCAAQDELSVSDSCTAENPVELLP